MPHADSFSTASDAASAFGTPVKPACVTGGGSPLPPPASRSGSFSPRGAGAHFRVFAPPPPAAEEAFGAPPPVAVTVAAAPSDPFSAPAAPPDPFEAPPAPPPRAPEIAPDAFSAASAPPVASADPFAAPAAPAIYNGGWGSEQPKASNAFAGASVFTEASPQSVPKTHQIQNAVAPDAFGGPVAPPSVSSTAKKKAAHGFDFGLHSELVSLDLNANGAPLKARSAVKKAPAVAMNKMATTERRSSMLGTDPMGAPQNTGLQQAMAMAPPPAQAMGMAPAVTFHSAFARYTPEQQQWLLAQPPHVQQQYLQ